MISVVVNFDDVNKNLVVIELFGFDVNRVE